MNTDQRQQLWDRFLAEWPVERIEAMTLAEYVSVEDKSTFTYWLETEARELGSIKGGSSEKFGIYKRADSSKRNGRNNYSHDDTYTWHSKYGEDAPTAFARIKQSILDVIKAVQVNDLDTIELIDIAPTLKWKVAFIYQNRSKLSVLNIYKVPVLRRAVKNSQATMAQAYSQLLTDKPDDVSLFDYYAKVWTSNQDASEQEIEQLIERMNMDAVNNLSNTKLQQLYELTEWAHDAGLDIYPVNIDNQFRIGRKGLGSTKSDAVFKLITVQKSNIKLGDAKYSLEYLATCEEDKNDFVEQYTIDREGYWPVDYAPNNSSTDTAKSNNGDSEMTMPSLNQILYGPPGTGKTYHTIEAAVKAAEPDFVWDTRAELKAKYDELIIAKRIRFVTFHQSYGYEEFVEGLKAKTTVDKSIEYVVENGVFKSISEAASISLRQADSGINEFGRVWKISIEGTYKNEAKTYCLKNNIAAIGWGDTGDLSSSERNEYFKAEGSNNQISLTNFSQEIAVGDLILCIDSNTSVEAVGVVRGDYFYSEHGLPSRADFQHHLPVDWIAKDFSIDFKQLNGNTQFHVPTCWNVERLSVNGVLQYLAAHGIKFNVNSNSTPSNYVLIIDEINRGNISKIFGELITLIEPSKRMSVDKKGEDESIQIKLPHSEPLFSVPDNLYLIGTMNTADRSIAMMDTALRRRFDFVEMMPNPELLKDTVVNGIDLAELLKVINQRIEILYDREHTLGHAFFMPVKALVDAGEKEEAFNALVSVFKNKIIPLLEEYFVEDWDKIRLVLADNQKPEHLQFVEENVQKTEALTRLFGKGHQLDQYGQSVVKYTLAMDNADVWSDAHAYTGIYQTVVNQSDSSPE